MPLTERDIVGILAKFESDVKSYRVETKPDALGFQGVYYTLSVELDSATLKCFIKYIPQGSDLVNEFYKDLNTFVKEVQIYYSIFSKMKVFTEHDLWPECYAAETGKYVVLQDMTSSGWVMTSHVDLNHLKVAAESLGEFHAASLSLLQEDRNFVGLMSSTLTETMFSSNLNQPGRKMWDSFCRVASHIVSRYLQPPSKIDVFAVLQTAISYVRPSDKFQNCLNHGDPWINNMFFRYEHGTPCCASFVDFQSARFAPPALDLSIFLHIFDPENVDELVEIYHRKLVESLQRNRSYDLTKSELDESLIYYQGAGISIAALYIFLTKLPEEYLSKILISQETFIPFALGCDYSPALKALDEDVRYRETVLRSLQRVIHYYSSR